MTRFILALSLSLTLLPQLASAEPAFCPVLFNSLAANLKLATINDLEAQSRESRTNAWTESKYKSVSTGNSALSMGEDIWVNDDREQVHVIQVFSSLYSLQSGVGVRINDKCHVTGFFSSSQGIKKNGESFRSANELSMDEYLKINEKFKVAYAGINKNSKVDDLKVAMKRFENATSEGEKDAYRLYRQIARALNLSSTKAILD